MLKRSGILTLLLFGSLAFPALANADSLTLSAAGARAGDKGSVTSTISTSLSNGRIDIVVRPARYGACDPTGPTDDARKANYGGDDTIVAGPVEKAANGTKTWPVSPWPSAGAYKLCGWITDYDRSGNGDVVTASAARDVTVEGASGSLKLTVKQTGASMDQNRPRLSGTARARVRGTTSGHSALADTVISAARACPASLRYDGSTFFDFSGFQLMGAFDKTGRVNNPLKVGSRYKACVYLQDESSGGATVARASRTFALRSKPRDPVDHFLSLTAAHAYAREKTDVPDTLTCHKGRQWRAYPTKIRFSYRWFRSGKRVKGRTTATYRTTRADHNRRMTCDVVARNAVGTTVEGAANPMYVVH